MLSPKSPFNGFFGTDLQFLSVLWTVAVVFPSIGIGKGDPDSLTLAFLSSRHACFPSDVDSFYHRPVQSLRVWGGWWKAFPKFCSSHEYWKCHRDTG